MHVLYPIYFRLCECEVFENYCFRGNKGVTKIPGSFSPVHFETECVVCSADTWKVSFEQMDLWWSLCTLCLLACHAAFTIGDSGLCCCVPCHTCDISSALPVPFVC